MIDPTGDIRYPANVEVDAAIKSAVWHATEMAAWNGTESEMWRLTEVVTRDSTEESARNVVDDA